MSLKHILPAALLIAAAALTFSCTKELNGPDTSADTLTFTATIQPFEARTKTILADGDVIEWEAGELICINGSIYYSILHLADHTQATFVKESGPEPIAPYKAYYPASICGESGTALPATQTWTEGRISNVPMFAAFNYAGINIPFKSICALLELTITGDDGKKVSKIEVSTTDKALWGAIDIENDIACVKSTETADENKLLTLDCGESGASLTNDGTKFWVAIPAGTYDNLTFKVYGDKEDQYLKMSTKAQKVLQANHIYTVALSSSSIRTRRDVTVSNSDPGKGTVSVDNTTAVKEGTTVTITVSPTIDYPISDISVVDEDGQAVTLSGTGNELTFVMPDSDVTVTSNFYPVPSPNLMNASFNLNGTAMDLSDSKIRFVVVGAPEVEDRGEAFSQCAFASNATWGGNGAAFFSFTYKDYQQYQSFYQALLDGFSIECWLMGHPDLAGTEAVAVGSFDNGGFGIESVGNKLCFTVYTDGSYRYAISDATISDGVYYHVVGVYSKSRGKAELYVDGVLSGSVDAPGDYRPPFVNKNLECRLSIGGVRNSAYADAYSGFGWNGDIVYARMYSAPLSASQAAYLQEHKNDAPATQGSFDGHDWVQLNKGGVRWATTNVGANSPEDEGGFYAWAETSTKTNYTWYTYEYSVSGFHVDEPEFKHYVTDSKFGHVDGYSTILRSDDVAQQSWGGSNYMHGHWRIPSAADWHELKGHCTWEGVNVQGKKCLKVTGSNGNSIYLPVAGYFEGNSKDRTTEAHFWTSSLHSTNSIAYEALFEDLPVEDQPSFEIVTTCFRYHGLPIRPVFY